MDRDGRPVSASRSTGAFTARGRARKRSLVALAVVAALLAAPAAASATRFSSAATVREEMIEAGFHSRPLYPDVLPDPLWLHNAATFTHGHFFVWKGQTNTNPEWFNIRYRCHCLARSGYAIQVAFSRGPVSDIAKAVDLSQSVQGRSVGRVQLRGKNLYRFRLHRWFGFMWRQNGFAYSVFAQYSPRAGWWLVRDFIDRLRPLGRLWNGQDSQGWQVSVYRSSGGVDWVIGATLTCLDDRVIVDKNENLAGVHRDAMFQQAYSYRWRQKPFHLHESGIMRGTFPAARGAPVTGTFAAHNRRVGHPKEPRWDCGVRLTWQASPFSADDKTGLS
jgi:hypothetical protein